MCFLSSLGGGEGADGGGVDSRGDDSLESSPLHKYKRLAETEVGDTSSVRCRWDDDVVFRNQGKTEKRPKRFINDTIRNDFHVNFMNTVFRQFCVFSQTVASYNSWE